MQCVLGVQMFPGMMVWLTTCPRLPFFLF